MYEAMCMGMTKYNLNLNFTFWQDFHNKEMASFSSHVPFPKKR
jgi:hypothetical protein